MDDITQKLKNIYEEFDTIKMNHKEFDNYKQNMNYIDSILRDSKIKGSNFNNNNINELNNDHTIVSPRKKITQKLSSQKIQYIADNDLKISSINRINSRKEMPIFNRDSSTSKKKMRIK